LSTDEEEVSALCKRVKDVSIQQKDINTTLGCIMQVKAQIDNLKEQPAHMNKLQHWISLLQEADAALPSGKATVDVLGNVHVHVR
jgi:hypothetical protein